MSNEKPSLVWDLPLRIFHWSIVILLVFSWYSVEVMEDLDKHFISGYCVLALLLFRLAWGFFGTQNAKFRAMLFSPSAILSYAKSLFSGSTIKFTGHNPLGSLSVFALLGFMLLQAVTGLFSNDEDWYFGPLSDYVSTQTADRLTEIHHLNFNILLGFVVLHVLAVLFYLVVKKDNLVKPMFTGKKLVEEGGIESSKILRALLILGITAGCVFALVKFA